MSELLEIAAILYGCLRQNPAPERVAVMYTIKAVSPGAALAMSARIADAFGGEVVHHVEAGCFNVHADRLTATVWYEVAE